MALAICSGVALDFHSTVTTWITLFGFIGAPNRKAAATISTAQTAKIVLFVINVFFLSSGIPVYRTLFREMTQEKLHHLAIHLQRRIFVILAQMQHTLDADLVHPLLQVEAE